jgi:hypothetical protein
VGESAHVSPPPNEQVMKHDEPSFPDDLAAFQSFDTSVPNVARIYDFLLGGKDNYQADRDAALRLQEAIPDAARAARDNRAFLARAVDFLVREAGIRQFLDIGTGLPAGVHVHEIVQAAGPAPRVVYVDSDPVVIAHSRALLANAGGRIGAVHADVRYPRHLLTLPGIREIINFEKPVGVLLVAMLHFVADIESPWTIVRCIMDHLAPGSYLVISHVTGDEITAEAAEMARNVYNGASETGTARSREDIERFFDGLELVPPGITNVTTWRAGYRQKRSSRPTLFYAGIGRKTDGGRDE